MSEISGREIKDVAEQGSTLVFIVYPEAIATMPWAPVWSIFFFLMLLTLGLDSSVLFLFQPIERTNERNRCSSAEVKRSSRHSAMSFLSFVSIEKSSSVFSSCSTSSSVYRVVPAAAFISSNCCRTTQVKDRRFSSPLSTTTIDFSLLFDHHRCLLRSHRCVVALRN